MILSILDKFCKKKPPPIEYGLKIKKPRRQGEIFYASGKLSQSSGFTHHLSCQISPNGRIEGLPIDDGLNVMLVERIVTYERKERFRGAATVVFRGVPNYQITLIATPSVGKTRILFNRGLRISVSGFSSESIAKKICIAMMDEASRLRYPNIDWLIKESMFTAQFWHCVVLQEYVRILWREG
jgi:hypothetical protein